MCTQKLATCSSTESKTMVASSSFLLLFYLMGLKLGFVFFGGGGGVATLIEICAWTRSPELFVKERNKMLLM